MGMGRIEDRNDGAESMQGFTLGSVSSMHCTHTVYHPYTMHPPWSACVVSLSVSVNISSHNNMVYYHWNRLTINGAIHCKVTICVFMSITVAGTQHYTHTAE